MENGNKYVSNIITNYGDTENVKKDVQTLNEINSRQGSNLLIDVIAESAGTNANKFKLNAEERQRLITALVRELETKLDERL